MQPDSAIPPSMTTRLAAEASRSREEKRAVWGFVWILFGFKMATGAAIIMAARTEEAAVLLAATTWYWLPIPVVALSGGIIFRYRLRKVRRRREELRRSEWLLDEAPRSEVPTQSS